jgi:hypothetical protein
MKRSPWIVFCLALSVAGLIGQTTAFAATTNAVYDITSISTAAVGKHHVVVTNSATAVFLSDSNCVLIVGSYDFTGTYAVGKNNKQVTLTRDAAGWLAMSNNVVNIIEPYLPGGVSISLTRGKASKITIKDGAPSKATDSIRGKLSETVKGKVKSKGLTLKTLWTDWVLVSGTNI